MKALAILMVYTAAALSGAQAQSPPPSRRGPLPPEAVTLLPGPLLDAQERNRAYLRSLDPERLLHNFRVNAGLPSSAEPLGGWERPDCELRGHFVGHYLTACAIVVQTTGDTLIRQRAGAVVRGLALCQQALGTSGYLSAFPLDLIDRVETGKRVWAPWYTLHKIFQGLLDMASRTGDTTALRVLNGALSWTKQRTDRLDERQMQAMLNVEFGGMGELLGNAYRLTGDPAHLALARRFEKRSFTDPLARRTDQLKGLHANTHIPQAIAAARLYETTGEQRFAGIARYFWEQVVNRRTYVTGGTSNYEHWRTDPGTLVGELSDESHENCCTYNLLRLTRILQEWTPDPARGDYYERALYNGILPTQHPGDGGGLMYFVPMRAGSFKMFGVPDSSYWCCNGSGIESFATLNAGAFYRDSADLFVDLFLPSVLEWKERGVTIRIETRYPEEPTVRFLLQTNGPARFALRVRVPGWISAAPVWTLNGKALRLESTPCSYAMVERTWHSGDSLVVRFPMGLRQVQLPGDPSLVSVMYGPVVLACALGTDGMTDGMRGGFGTPDVERMFGEGASQETPVLVPPSNDPKDWIRPVDGMTLAFRTHGSGRSSEIDLVPFFRIAGQRYATYFRTLSPAEWESRKAALTAFPAGIVDSVRVGDAQAEEEHNFQAWRYTRGDSAGSSWVSSPLWLRYDLNLIPRSKSLLRLTIGGMDSSAFEVLLDGLPLTTIVPKPHHPGDPGSVTIPLDPAVVGDRRRVAVMLKGRPGHPTPRLFGCAIQLPR
jgi:uncharacterized protein